MSEYAHLIAAFKAKGGTVQKVEAGARAMDPRTVYALAHGTDAQREAIEAKKRREENAEWEAERRDLAERDAFAAARYDGWSTDDAHDYAQNARA